MKNTFLLILLFFFQFLSAKTLSPASTNSDLPSWMEHLALGEVETIELHIDLDALYQRESTNDDYQDARIVYVDNMDQAFSWSLGVKPRGKYRRRICDFPPLKLNFSKKELGTKGLADFDKYKLVTHCTDNRLASKEAVIREYLTYKLYQELSPNSFKVHLFRIRYIDTSGKQSSFQRYGFIIESSRELEKRLNAEECEGCYVSGPTDIDASTENSLAVFQYMIGNTDFSVTIGQNLKTFTPSNGGKAILVAYDFDFAAIVAADYAIPARHLGQEKLTDRVYLGYLVPDSLLEETLAVFEEKQDAFLNIIRREKRLSINAKSEMRTYIKDFFGLIDGLKEPANNARTYQKLRESAQQAVPTGGNPEHYGVRK